MGYIGDEMCDPKKCEHAEELATMNARVAELTWRLTHDDLTGILNRTGMIERFEEFSSATPVMTVCFLDVDHFKRTNDTLGHEAGDAILVEFARELHSLATEHGGVAVRLSGDEFALVFPGEATPVASVAPSAVKSCAFSMGVAVGNSEPENWPHLLKSADRAMYVAKQTDGSSSALGEDTDPPTPTVTRRWRNRSI